MMQLCVNYVRRGLKLVLFSGKLVRSNSADSVLSTSDAPSTVVMRKNARASSAGESFFLGVTITMLISWINIVGHIRYSA